MAEKKNKVLRDARIEMNYLTGDEEVRRLAELRDKWESDWNSSIDWDKAEGNIEGKREIAKNMLKKKIDINVISEVTGLTIKEIKELR